MSTTSRGSWWGRHPLLAALIASIVVAWTISAASGGDNSGSDRPRKAPPGALDPQGPKHQAKAEPTTRSSEPAPAAPRTYLVTRVVDGDTIDLGNGERVRLVGMDTPEVGECGFEQAAARLGALVLGRQVRLGTSDQDRDYYGRLLRYVDVGPVDAGLRLIHEGLATARYDSRDGYGFHPREHRYVAADRGSRPYCAAKPQPLVAAAPAPATGGGCAPGYAPCVPSYPPDVDCADVEGPITVTGTDPHGLDGEGDGIACE